MYKYYVCEQHYIGNINKISNVLFTIIILFEICVCNCTLNYNFNLFFFLVLQIIFN